LDVRIAFQFQKGKPSDLKSMLGSLPLLQRIAYRFLNNLK